MMSPNNTPYYGLSVSVILLVCLGKLTASQERSLIPPNFDKICKVQTASVSPIRIKCDLSRNDQQRWRLDTLRDWISKSERNQSDVFSYHITCDQSGGSVSLPWPMKCPRLEELTIMNCNITDIYADFGKSHVLSIPAQLRKLEVIDSAMVLKQLNLLKMFNAVKNITSQFDCLHDETLERLVFRNVSYILINDISKEVTTRCLQKMLSQMSGVQDSEILPEPPSSNDTVNMTQSDDDGLCDLLNIENVLNLPKKLRDLSISCNYRRLRYLDDSISNTLSVYSHRFLTKFSKFPVLEVLNYSYNHIQVIPQELSDWSFYFDSLKHMDLSHNSIHTVAQRLTQYTSGLVNDTYINLQYNNITTLTLLDLQFLQAQRNTFTDIRNNPLKCDCRLKNFLQAIAHPDTFTASFKKYEYLKEMTCHLPACLSGRTLNSLTVDDLGCPSDSRVVPFVVVAVIALVVVAVAILAFIYRREIRILFKTHVFSRNRSPEKEAPEYACKV